MQSNQCGFTHIPGRCDMHIDSYYSLFIKTAFQLFSVNTCTINFQLHLTPTSCVLSITFWDPSKTLMCLVAGACHIYDLFLNVPFICIIIGATLIDYVEQKRRAAQEPTDMEPLMDNPVQEDELESQVRMIAMWFESPNIWTTICFFVFALIGY